MINIRKLESELWESTYLLRADFKLTSNQYCTKITNKRGNHSFWTDSVNQNLGL